MTETRVRWLTPREAAVHARCGINKVRSALQSGELHGHQPDFNGHWRVTETSVDAWVRGRDGKAECGCVSPIRLAKRSA